MELEALCFIQQINIWQNVIDALHMSKNAKWFKFKQKASLFLGEMNHKTTHKHFLNWFEINRF